MEDTVDTLHRLAHGGGIGDRANRGLHRIGRAFPFIARPRIVCPRIVYPRIVYPRTDIENGDLITTFTQRFDEVAANKTASSSNQRSIGHSPSASHCDALTASLLTTILAVTKLSENTILMIQLNPIAHYVRHHIVGMAVVIFLAAVCLMSRDAVARENFVSAPSSQLVSDFYEDISRTIFLDPPQTAISAQQAAIRGILARSVDAESISRFILGRYGAHQPSASTSTPADRFLDFATMTVMRMAPHRGAPGDGRVAPPLTILTMTMRSDQTRLVQSEILLPNGRSLPLTWEVADRPAGLRIEDVNCLGISLRLMLRSAVAEAAAEHPEDAHDLGRLLNAGHALAQFSGSAPAMP